MYSRKLDDTVYTFGHEGVLYRRSFVMYDKQTDSLWVHTTGEAVKGPSKGKVLRFLPSKVMSWKRWKALHPDTTVLTGKRARRGMGRFGFQAHPERYGLSVGQGPHPKLYPISQLAKAGVINDAVDDTPIVVIYDKASGTAHAYERSAHTFTAKDDAMVDEKGRAWDPLRGRPAGEGAERLAPLPATMWLVERWKGFHPHDATYEPPETR